MLILFELFEEREHRLVDGIALGEDLLVVKADDVALRDGEAVDVGRPHGVRHLTCLHVVERVDHVGLVLLEARLGAERERRRKALRHVLGGDDVDGAVIDERLRLLRRQNDVLVVGEDEHVLRIDLLHRRRDVGSGGVHRLPAFDDAVDEEILEDVADALTRADGEHALILLFRLDLGFQGAVLFEHVLDLGPIELAQLQRVGESDAGAVGMHMHLDHFEIADADDAVADVHQVFPELIDIGKRGALFQIDDEEFRAVGELDVAEVHADDIGIVAEVRLGLLLDGLRLHFGRDLLAHDGSLEAAHDGHEAHAARVDDARLLQNGKKFGGHGKRPVALRDDRGDERFEIFILARHLDGELAHEAHDGKDGAFLGDGDGVIGNFGALFHRLGKSAGIHFGLADAEHRADAAEDLRKDDARVAARAAQRPLRDAVAHFHKGIGRGRGKLLDRRLHGEGHIRTRIAVGHGEDVERVYLRPVIFQHFRADQNHLSERRTVDRFLHEMLLTLPLWNERRTRASLAPLGKKWCKAQTAQRSLAAQTAAEAAKKAKFSGP